MNIKATVLLANSSDFIEEHNTDRQKWKQKGKKDKQ
jgi:hypothetical protein